MNEKAMGTLLVGAVVTALSSVFDSGNQPAVTWAFFAGLSIVAVGGVMLIVGWVCHGSSH